MRGRGFLALVALLLLLLCGRLLLLLADEPGAGVQLRLDPVTGGLLLPLLVGVASAAGCQGGASRRFRTIEIILVFVAI